MDQTETKYYVKLTKDSFSCKDGEYLAELSAKTFGARSDAIAVTAQELVDAMPDGWMVLDHAFLCDPTKDQVAELINADPQAAEVWKWDFRNWPTEEEAVTAMEAAGWEEIDGGSYETSHLRSPNGTLYARMTCDDATGEWRWYPTQYDPSDD